VALDLVTVSLLTQLVSDIGPGLAWISELLAPSQVRPDPCTWHNPRGRPEPR
jgi:hypothetical protein